MSRRRETGVLDCRIEIIEKHHHGNGIWQRSGSLPELWASTPPPLPSI
jgi:hypothetical protein